MIGRLHGTLVAKRVPVLLLDVQGVGYELEAPMTTFYELPAVGAAVTLHTHLVVRDDAHLLYGFATEGERSLFRSLLKVSGVGAKLALTILSGTSVDGFVRCVQNNDSASLTRLPGIGKKTAERLVLEMRDRLADWHAPPAITLEGKTTVADGTPAPVADAISALVALGYKPQEASRMVHALEVADLGSEQIIRRALQSMVKT